MMATGRLKNQILLNSLFLLFALILNTVALGMPVLFINVVWIVAFFIWLNRKSNPTTGQVEYLFGAGIIVQCLHFWEEYAGGYFMVFPQLLGVSPWSASTFVIFNTIWLLLFVIGWFLLRLQDAMGVFIFWFFLIGGELLNGTFHVGISLLQLGYFPGLWTGIVHLVLGILILTRLRNSSLA